jgi:o-succinylbenzoate---CoA ligase
VPAPAVAARLAAHPAVQAVEVVGVPDDEWGQRVVAVLVGSLDLDGARDWVAAEHPRSWAPRQLLVVDALPMLPSGKVDRVALAAHAAARACISRGSDLHLPRLGPASSAGRRGWRR